MNNRTHRRMNETAVLRLRSSRLEDKTTIKRSSFKMSILLSGKTKLKWKKSRKGKLSFWRDSWTLEVWKRLKNTIHLVGPEPELRTETSKRCLPSQILKSEDLLTTIKGRMECPTTLKFRTNQSWLASKIQKVSKRCKRRKRDNFRKICFSKWRSWN